MSEFNRAAMLKHFGKILKDQPRNIWVEGSGYSIYIRHARHILWDGNINVPGFASECLDLSSINIKPPHNGKGHFTALLDFVEHKCRFPIYVENVQAERLQKFLLGRGYKRVHNPGYPDVCFYKIREAVL